MADEIKQVMITLTEICNSLQPQAGSVWNILTMMANEISSTRIEILHANQEIVRLHARINVLERDMLTKQQIIILLLQGQLTKQQIQELYPNGF